MPADDWLAPWLPEIASLSAQRPVLDLGCGACEDAAFLERRGYGVIAADVGAHQLARCAQNAKNASLLCLDLTDPLPFPGDSFCVILASLCLHYFPWPDTLRIVGDIRRCLTDDGLLLCRLNSTRDIHFGALGSPAVDPAEEKDYYRVGNRRKRFFDEQAVTRLFTDGWAFVSLEEKTIARYRRPKVVWEAALRKKRTT